MWIGKGIKVVCTSNVGGGSHIWAALMEKAPPEYWDGRADGLSDAVMAPHYERAPAFPHPRGRELDRPWHREYQTPWKIEFSQRP